MKELNDSFFALRQTVEAAVREGFLHQIPKFLCRIEFRATNISIPEQLQDVHDGILAAHEQLKARGILAPFVLYGSF